MAAFPAQSKTLAALGLVAQNGAEAAVSGLSVDSRLTKPGHLFAALPGSNVHGAEFVKYALRMGAVAVLTDAKGAAIANREITAAGAAVVLNDDPRMALALAAAAWFGAQPETMIAVTGTNGKTSVATFCRQIWETLGRRAVNFGTTGLEGAMSAPLSHTTPEPITLHRLLRDLSDGGITHAAMEASSHGLAQRRLDGVHLAAAAFTNFTQDHLDYHAGFDAYFQAKLGLFNRVLHAGAHCVINIDDPRGDEIAACALARGQTVIRVGRSAAADLRILGQRFDSAGQDVRFGFFGKTYGARLGLIGGFQADNVLSAAALVIACGEAPDVVFAALNALVTVRGRMELAGQRRNGAAVFVDYAHTPDALATALGALRPHVLGRLIVVFGAGGDRDKSKRILMGQAAARNADVLFVTDDNPRSEKPSEIRREILAGCPEASEIGDRAAAILSGVDALGPGDALLIAGKGHETGQIVGDDSLPFNDVEQASVAIAALDGLGT